MKTTLKKLILLIEIIFSVSIYGCSAGWWESHTHMDLYKELNSNKVDTISIFPVKTSNLDSNEIREVNEYFMIGFKKILKNYILISPEESFEKIIRDSLSEKYNQLSGIYTSGLKMEKLLKDAGNIIGCDAIILPEIYISSGFITVIYTLYSTNDVKLLFSNYVSTDIYSDSKSGPVQLMKVIKADIESLLKHTHK